MAQYFLWKWFNQNGLFNWPQNHQNRSWPFIEIGNYKKPHYLPRGEGSWFQQNEYIFWASRESDHFLGVCDYSVTRWNYVFLEIWDLSDFGYYKRSSKSSISYLRVIEMDLNFQYFMVSFEIRNFTAWTVRHRTSNERNSYK